MSTFLDGLEEKLAAMEQEPQALPREIDSAAAHLDRATLRRLFLRLNRDYSKLLEDEKFAARACSIVVAASALCRNQLSSVDESLVRVFYAPDVRVAIGRGKVKPIAISQLARENRTVGPEIILNLRERGYIVLGWDQYQKLLDEIGNLISGNEEQGRITEPPRIVISLDELSRLMPKL